MPTFSDPSALICSGLYLALLMGVGYAVVCCVIGRDVRHWLELLGLCFATGAGTTSMVLFACSAAGHSPSKTILIVVALIAIVVISVSWKQSALVAPSVPSPRRKFDAITLLGIAGLGLIVAAVTNVMAHAGWEGLNDIDAFATWMFKAKVVALEPLRPLPAAFTLPALSYSHQDYPLSLPFLVAGLYAALGHINEEQAKILLLPIYFSLMALMYSAVRRIHRRAIAVAVTAIFAASPTLTQNAGLLVAETPLLLAWTAALFMLCRWMQSQQRSDLLLCGLFSAFAAFTKNEGLALMPVMGIITLALSIRKRKGGAIKDWIYSAVVSVVTLFPWLIYRTLLPRTHEDYGGKLAHASTIIHNLDRLIYVLPQFLGRLFDGTEAGRIWYLLILVALLGFRGFMRPATVVLWILLSIQLSLYISTFVVTPWDVRVLVPLVGPKLLTQASPLAALLIAQHLCELRWTSKRGL